MQSMDSFSAWFITFVGGVIISASSDTRVGYFWQVTDLHYSNNYTLHGSSRDVCWKNNEALIYNSQPGIFGNFNCDSTSALVFSAIYAMKQIYTYPDFILWTGDSSSYVEDSYYTNNDVVNSISKVSQILKEMFPNTLVLPLLGGHDMHPKYQMHPGTTNFQTRIANLWEEWLTPLNAFADFERDGRYIAHIPDSSITVIVLNTILWSQLNNITNNDNSAMDPAGQFAWLDTTIESLSANNRKIYLVGHIPPGSFERNLSSRGGMHWYQPRYNRQYIDLINKHSASISAQFFGHQHTDAFRIFFSDDDSNSKQPTSYLLVSPSVSPVAGTNNPAIRLVSYDTQSGQVHEVSTFFLDLEEANDKKNAVWKLEYNLTSILGLSQISPNTLYDATIQMQANPTFFENYYSVNTVQLHTQCTTQCLITQICAMTEVDYDAFYQCNGCQGLANALCLLTSMLLIFLIYDN